MGFEETLNGYFSENLHGLSRFEIINGDPVPNHNDARCVGGSSTIMNRKQKANAMEKEKLMKERIHE